MPRTPEADTPLTGRADTSLTARWERSGRAERANDSVDRRCRAPCRAVSLPCATTTSALGFTVLWAVSGTSREERPPWLSTERPTVDRGRGAEGSAGTVWLWMSS
ncbi:hypothetical protein GCM10010121_082170 [Streptomyces brasiliensis]|uniref:Uncharacterized protein n=1 Tax=Streptomyces brasiliensis TaxID=1954 RepID=A0A917P346_9ACTN|nr:hypothetical protein GCM10010121_082170 [Streptomyces brasiliensis]